ncbi:hypothetical protein [Microvirga sp. Mcv34]|uniref:hypothetical protein n=1 Tax=Microvirga sp. Mcv34 TaxID=2926016 RepID=UPI0021CA4C0B|nr:hypothetical protein [Microvirga sp. Mcv34]
MPVDRNSLRLALNELVRLRRSAEDPRRFRAQLYGSALAEWAGRLGVDQPKLDRIVHVRESVSGR